MAGFIPDSGFILTQRREDAKGLRGGVLGVTVVLRRFQWVAGCETAMLGGSANGLGVLQDAHIKFLIGEALGRKIDRPSERSPPLAISGGPWLVA